MLKQEKITCTHTHTYIVRKHKNCINFAPELVQIIQIEVNKLATMPSIKLMQIHVNYIQTVTRIMLCEMHVWKHSSSVRLWHHLLPNTHPQINTEFLIYTSEPLGKQPWTLIFYSNSWAILSLCAGNNLK
jgi:hypothetical protein